MHQQLTRLPCHPVGGTARATGALRDRSGWDRLGVPAAAMNKAWCPQVTPLQGRSSAGRGMGRERKAGGRKSPALGSSGSPRRKMGQFLSFGSDQPCHVPSIEGSLGGSQGGPSAPNLHQQCHHGGWVTGPVGDTQPWLWPWQEGKVLPTWGQKQG